MQKVNWIRQHLSQMNPSTDARRYAQLSFETRYGIPIFLHALFSIAFAYNMADPKIAQILYRDGNGKIIRQTRRRNFETLVFLKGVYAHGVDAKGIEVIKQIKKMHASYTIDNRLFLYTLATFACLPKRLSDTYAGKNGIDPRALEAQFSLWQDVGHEMGITDIPKSLDAYIRWMADYETTYFQYSPAAEAVTNALAEEWADYWFPPALQSMAQQLFFSMVEPKIQPFLGIKPQSKIQQYAISLLFKGFIKGVDLLPDARKERDMTGWFDLTQLPN